MRYHPGTIVRSLGISDFRIDGVPTNEEEFLSMFHKKMPDGTYSNSPFTFGVTWDQVKTKLDELNNQERFRLLREERNRRLAECDWVVTKNAEYGYNISKEWRTYRQALRDLPSITYAPELDEAGNLKMDSVAWPTPPE